MIKSNFIFVILFLIILFLPTLGILTGVGNKFHLYENRSLAGKPKMGLYEAFASQFEKYFADHFGFRSIFIQADRYLKLNVFGSFTNNDVSIGKDNWLFYTSDQNYLDVINAVIFSESDLRGIKENLEDAKNYFEKNGIKFIVIIAPNKSSVYEQYLPSYMRKANPKSRLQQLTEYLGKEENDVIFINPTLELKKESLKSQVYRKYDTHWNSYGGFIAYKLLMLEIEKFYPSLKAKGLEDFEVSYKETNIKDLELLLGVGDIFKEKDPIFTPKVKRAINTTEECPKPYMQCAEQLYKVKDKKLPRLTMYRDSFGVALIPFLSEHFSVSHFIWKVMPLDTNVVLEDQADVVIFEIVERDLWRLQNQFFKY